MVKRAIALAGGGPAVGLSIGALKRLEEEPDISFDVASTACIGAWLATVYYQSPKGEGLAAVDRFFRQVFQPNDVYSRFPIATVFAPNIPKLMENAAAFILDPKSYNNLVVPHKIIDAAEDLLRFMTDPRQWTPAYFNTLIHNSVMAANPIARFLTSMVYLSPTKGLSQLFYPDSPILSALDLDALSGPDKPHVYHNAYNLTQQRLQVFCNKPDKGLPPITARSLCAGSALPYFEDTVEIDGETYCEGATVNSVNFEHLLEKHPDLDEVWVSRILDRKQVHKPENLYDALNNLVMLFAATTSEYNVKLFKLHLQQIGSKVKLIEIPVAQSINYDWSYDNLDRSIRDGYDAASLTVDRYRAGEFSVETLDLPKLRGACEDGLDRALANDDAEPMATVASLRQGQSGAKRAA